MTQFNTTKIIYIILTTIEPNTFIPEEYGCSRILCDKQHTLEVTENNQGYCYYSLILEKPI